MIKQVSWLEYFAIMAIAVTIYYAIVLIIYYRTDILRVLNGLNRQASGNYKTYDSTPLKSNVSTEKVTQEEVLFSSANKLLSELKDIFQRNYILEELIMAIQIKLNEYPSLKQTPFKVSVENYIKNEIEKRSIHLSEEDLRVLW